MADGGYATPALTGSAVESCWLCGIRQPVAKMVADGGSACSDVRWYCLDARGCTERWTAPWARPGDIYPGTAQASPAPARRQAGLTSA